MTRTTPVGQVFVPGDLVRLAALVSVAVAPFVLSGVGVALFLLVLGGVMVPRALGMPAVLDVAYGSAILLAAWAAQLEWYQAVPWLDLAMHAVCTGLIAAVAHLALERRALVPGRRSAGSMRGRAAVVISTTGLGAVGAILWEIGEWAGHTFVDRRISVGYDDTVGDLAWGLVGALAAGVVLAALRDGRGAA